jgi:hypothetical protein
MAFAILPPIFGGYMNLLSRTRWDHTGLALFVGILSLNPAFAALEAQDLEFGGEVKLGAWSDMDPNQSFRVRNYGNMDVLWNTRVKTDQNVGAYVQLRARSAADSLATPVDFGLGRPANALNPLLSVDAFEINWLVAPGALVQFGSWRYHSGALQDDFLFGTAEEGAAILKDRRITGLGADIGGIEVKIGLPEGKNEAFSAFAKYRHPLIDQNRRKLSVEPSLEFNFGNRNRHPFVLGVDADFSESKESWRYASRVAASMLGDPNGDESSYGTLGEAGIERGILSANGSLWYFFPGGLDSVARAYNPMSVDQHAKGEVAVSLGMTSLRLPVSWTNPSGDRPLDDFWMVLPTVSLYPNDNAEFRFFGGVRIAENAWGPFERSYHHGVFGLRADLRF